MQESNADFVIYVINTGSTSTKLSLFRNSNMISTETFRHGVEEMEKLENIWDQYDFRSRIALEWIGRFNETLSAVVGIGGLLKPVEGGTYRVSESMISDARANLQGEHASNLGCAVAQRVAQEYDCPSFVVDPVSVDEFDSVARYSGHPWIKRRSLSHALSIHAVARIAAEQTGAQINDTNFIVAHLGGGISVAPVKAGRIIDANDASSDGPFSPDRTGGLPLQQFMDVCFSGEHTQTEIRRMVMGKGGLLAYLGTNSAEDVEKLINNGNEKAREIYAAMAYQIAKEIGAMSTVLNGRVDSIILTGGLAASSLLTDWIRERVGFIAPVRIVSSEDEMKSLALGAFRVLQGKENASEY